MVVTFVDVSLGSYCYIINPNKKYKQWIFWNILDEWMLYFPVRREVRIYTLESGSVYVYFLTFE